MSKYTPQQLKAMAKEAIEDRDFHGGMRYMPLVMSLCIRTGMNSAEVEANIESLAATGHSN